MKGATPPHPARVASRGFWRARIVLGPLSSLLGAAELATQRNVRPQYRERLHSTRPRIGTSIGALKWWAPVAVAIRVWI
jgi:hypothetical protein